MPAKPKIGQLQHFSVFTRKYGFGPRYWRCIEESGAKPVRVPISSPRDALAWARRLDGLMLPGGMDIPAELYGQKPHPHANPAPPELIRMEQAMIEAFIAAEKPILAICHGHQLLNVMFGGSLYQDIREVLPETPIHFGPRLGYVPHKVKANPGTYLADMLGEREFTVKSSHYQSVAQLGRSVKAVCTTDDGIIEATQFPVHSRVISVQWHPEFLPRSRATKVLFHTLAEEAAGVREPASLDSFLDGAALPA